MATTVTGRAHDLGRAAHLDVVDHPTLRRERRHHVLARDLRVARDVQHRRPAVERRHPASVDPRFTSDETVDGDLARLGDELSVARLHDVPVQRDRNERAHSGQRDRAALPRTTAG
ncbi:hypothetical protein KG102_16325 [Cellulomonas fengjieae]|uniref:hypothetical protein n=1 Tax=Cellulomonas fengjieae TaxID=2819978 RepID=UPI001BCE0292|nr:hypothetical protein [Cellulomonas fengjieae]QVI65635.1 hypothetical protein KG102_16325 [Cellulomonas fengjieae]